MNTHLTEDELVLHYYGEMTDAEERTAASHLSSCAGCHAEYRRLQRVLAVVDQAAVAGPELPEGFERTVWARLEPDLQRGRTHWFPWLVHSPGRLAWAAAVLVLVAAAFTAGRLTLRPPDVSSESVDGSGMEEGILLVDLSEHLDRSQMMLVELANAQTEGVTDISAERERAGELVAANRLYRRTAASTGDGTIVALLDDLERLLVELAAGPEEMSAAELAAVRQRIDAQALLFKVRVLSSEIRERQKTAFRARTGQRSAP